MSIAKLETIIETLRIQYAIDYVKNNMPDTDVNSLSEEDLMSIYTMLEMKEKKKLLDKLKNL